MKRKAKVGKEGETFALRMSETLLLPLLSLSPIPRPTPTFYKVPSKKLSLKMIIKVGKCSLLF